MVIIVKAHTLLVIFNMKFGFMYLHPTQNITNTVKSMG